MFNAIKYTKQLEEVGFSREQAEARLQVISEIIEGDLATKQDLNIVETSLKQHLKMVETNVSQEMNSMEARLELRARGIESEIQKIEYRLTIRLGGLLIVGFSALGTLIKLWH